MALISGILSAGGLVWDFAGCIEPQFDYFVDFSMIRMGVYVSGGPKGSVRLVTAGGLPAGRSVERAVETRLSAGDFTRAGWDSLQLPTDMSGMGQLYRQELVSMAPEGLGGIRAEVRGSDHEPVKMLSAVLDTSAAWSADGIRLHLGAGGRRLSLFDPQAGYIWPERVLAISCYIAFTKREDVALPYDAPVAIEEMAKKHGCRVRRYLRCPDRRRRRGGAPAGDGPAVGARRADDRRAGAGFPEKAACHTRGTDGGAAFLRGGDQDGALRRQSRPGAAADGRKRRGRGHRRRDAHPYGQRHPAHPASKLGKSLVLTAEADGYRIAAELCGELEQKLGAVSLTWAGKTVE